VPAKLLIIVVPLTVEPPPDTLLVSVVNPPALYPGLFGACG